MPRVGLPEGILAWERSRGDDRRLVVLNLATRYQFVDLDEGGVVEVCTTIHREGEQVDGRLLLGAMQGVVIRPG